MSHGPWFLSTRPLRFYYITLGSKFADIQTIWRTIMCTNILVCPRLNWTVSAYYN